MASWMVHLRVADILLDKWKGLDETAFVMGNIAPDSGVPSADWSSYTPDSITSHFKKPGGVDIDLERFQREYLSPEQVQGYNKRQYSFFLGYRTHLCTDVLWAEQIWVPCKEKYRRLKNLTGDLTYEQRQDMIWAIKADWYDLDFLYLWEHPDFRAFRIYREAVDFKNEFLDIFAEDAFENRREYITGFYLTGRENMDREYPYLTAERAERFVREAAGEKVLSLFFSHVSEDISAKPGILSI